MGKVNILAPLSMPIYNETKANVNQLSTRAFIDFITGDRSLDEFDEFVEEWKKLGGTAILEEAQGFYDKFNK